MGETFSKIIELIQNNTTFAIVVVVTVLIILLLSLTVIFYKIRVKAWKGLIPVYNIMALLEVLEIPVWMILVMFIPFVNIIGLPVMQIIIGWKLGNYCRKGLLMKLGLCLLMPLFIPILSLCYIDIDGTEEYVEVVKVPEGFSLDVVEVPDVQLNLSAISLMNTDIMEQLTPKTALRENIVSKEPPKKNEKTLAIGPNANEIEDLNKILPTADDLTMDYNSLYTNTLKKEEKEEVQEEKEIKVEPLTLATPKEDITLDYTQLYSNTPIEEEKKEEETSIETEQVEEEISQEEPAQEEPQIVIHDVVLEAAEPITENMGPIPINRRYDFQQSKKETKEEKSEEVKVEEEVPSIAEETTNIITEINPLAPPVIAPLIKESEKIEEPVQEEISVKDTETIKPMDSAVEVKVEDSSINLPMQAANPLDMGGFPTLADIPDLVLPKADEGNNKVAADVTLSPSSVQGLREVNAIETGTSVDQIVSMNIAEPSQLPVGVLTRPPGKEEPKPVETPVEPVTPPVMQEQRPMVNPNMTREEAMGFTKNYFLNGNPSNVNASMMPPTNSYIQQPTPQQQNGMNVGYNQMIQPQMPVGYQLGMQPGSTMPMMNGQMMQPQRPIPQQPINAASIFQVNTPNGAPLLRPVENTTPVAEKICPVCGVKLKQDAPICIMCGYKF